MAPYSNASATIQTIDELTPCMTRARAITQYVGASMSMTWDPTSASSPATSGTCLRLYLSENQAMMGVADKVLSG